jgi:aminoacylase
VCCCDELPVSVLIACLLVHHIIDRRIPRIQAHGPTGHGSRFIPDTAVSKLLEVANHAMEFRKAEESKLGYTSQGCAHCEAKKLGDVTTVNLTMLRAGVSMDEGKTFSLNVIPTLAEAGFDVRVCPQFDLKEFEAMLDSWTKAEGLSWEYADWTSPCKEHKVTSVDREENAWWGVFSDAANACGMKVQSEIFPAATDSRFLRAVDVKAFGFSPMARTPVLLHEHNEYLERKVYIEGISKYETLITALANAHPEVDAKCK